MQIGRYPSFDLGGEDVSLTPSNIKRLMHAGFLTKDRNDKLFYGVIDLSYLGVSSRRGEGGKMRTPVVETLDYHLKGPGFFTDHSHQYFPLSVLQYTHYSNHQTSHFLSPHIPFLHIAKFK